MFFFLKKKGGEGGRERKLHFAYSFAKEYFVPKFPPPKQNVSQVLQFIHAHKSWRSPFNKHYCNHFSQIYEKDLGANPGGTYVWPGFLRGKTEVERKLGPRSTKHSANV